MEKIQIATVKDIVEKIPLDKLDDFLYDLKSWVVYHHSIKNLIELGIFIPSTHMIWVDDDIRGLSAVHFNIVLEDQQ